MWASTKLAIALAACAGIATACDCRRVSVGDAIAQAGVVFRGTVISLRVSSEPKNVRYGARDYQIASFRVDRVWKGNIGKTFEMPAIEETTDCVGFRPRVVKVGSDLLVYASKTPPYLQYVTDICTRTGMADKADADFKILGPGRKPRD